MLKVLIVDDEVLIRSQIRGMIPWENHGFVVCGEAVNGEDAMARAGELMPDIMILDISMPVMDGVTLSSCMASSFPQCVLLVLSSYDQFEFVRETMKNGAVDYLLKHELTPERLLSVLGKAMEKRKTEERIRREKEMVDRRWDVLSPSLAQKYVREWILGLPNNLEEVRAYAQHFHFGLDGQNAVVVTMQILNFAVVTERYSNRDRSVMIHSITELCNSVVATMPGGSFTHVDQGRYAFLFSFGRSRSESQIHESIRGYVSKLRAAVEKYLNVRTVFGSSRPCGRFEEISRAYDAAVTEMEQQLFAGGVQETEVKVIRSLDMKRERLLAEAVSTGKGQETAEILEAVFQELARSHVDYQSVQLVVSDLLRVASKLAQAAGIDFQGIYESEGLTREQLRQCRSLKEIEDCVRSLYQALCMDTQGVRAIPPLTRPIQNAVDFIRRNYTRDISLEEASREAGLSAPYFSKLFRDETGHHFTEFLSCVRIDAAQKLMEGGKRAKEVYSRVGFNSYTYFIRVFREVTGETPLAFSNRKKQTP